MLVSCLAYSSTLKMEATCSSEMLADFNGLYGVMSQKTDLYVTNAVRTSDLTKLHKTTCRVYMTVNLKWESPKQTQNLVRLLVLFILLYSSSHCAKSRTILKLCRLCSFPDNILVLKVGSLCVPYIMIW
jgi:hypothetical protein